MTLLLAIIYLVGTNTLVVAARTNGVAYSVLDLAFWPLWLPGEIFILIFTVEIEKEDK